MAKSFVDGEKEEEGGKLKLVFRYQAAGFGGRERCNVGFFRALLRAVMVAEIAGFPCNHSGRTPRGSAVFGNTAGLDCAIPDSIISKEKKKRRRLRQGGSRGLANHELRSSRFVAGWDYYCSGIPDSVFGAERLVRSDSKVSKERSAMIRDISNMSHCSIWAKSTHRFLQNKPRCIS